MTQTWPIFMLVIFRYICLIILCLSFHHIVDTTTSSNTYVTYILVLLVRYIHLIHCSDILYKAYTSNKPLLFSIYIYYHNLLSLDLACVLIELLEAVNSWWLLTNMFFVAQILLLFIFIFWNLFLGMHLTSYLISVSTFARRWEMQQFWCV